MSRAIKICFIPEDTKFTPNLRQYKEVIEYLGKEGYIKNLKEDILELEDFDPKPEVKNISFKCISEYALDPPEIRKEDVYRRTVQQLKYYDFIEHKIKELENSRENFYDFNKFIQVLEALIEKKANEINKIRLNFPTTPKLRSLFLFNKKNLTLDPEYVQYWCDGIKVSIWPGLSSWKVTDNKYEFPSDETLIKHNFYIEIWLGYVADLDLFIATWAKEKYIEEGDLFLEDYLIELKHDERIQKILNDLSEILGTKMILAVDIG